MQKPAPKPYTMETFLDRAQELGCDGVSLESCFFPEFGPAYLARLKEKLDAYHFDRVYAWGHPDGLEAGGNAKAKEEMIQHIDHAAAIGAPGDAGGGQQPDVPPRAARAAAENPGPVVQGSRRGSRRRRAFVSPSKTTSITTRTKSNG